MASRDPFRVRTIGFDEAAQRLERVEDVATGPKRALLQAGIFRLLRFMAGIVQVDTGRLKNSLHPFVDDREAAIRTNVIYALPLEFMAGGKYSYIRRTAREEGPNVAGGVIVAFQEEISGAFRS